MLVLVMVLFGLGMSALVLGVGLAVWQGPTQANTRLVLVGCGAVFVCMVLGFIALP